MPSSNHSDASARIAPIGIAFLVATSIGWGINFPIMKNLLTEWPPLSARGLAGTVGAVALAVFALYRGQSLHVPRRMWLRLWLVSLLTMAAWTACMGLALVWLSGSEAAILSISLPVWASLLAWPILGERPTVRRVMAIVVAFGGLTILLGGDGLHVTPAKLGGFAMVLGGSIAFALGAVLSKKWPLTLPPMASATWQIGVGCLPVGLVGLAIETADFGAVTTVGWWALAYSTIIQFCVAYVAWFAALERLPASVAAIGTMAVPVFGVVASAIALHEPIGPVQIAALVLTLSGVVLATRS